MMTEPIRAPLVQADRTIWITLKPYVLTGLPERLQVFAIAVLHPIIEQVNHLLDVCEVAGEPGLFDTLIA